MIFSIWLLVAMLASLVDAKKASCVQTLSKTRKDFYYCTKFSAGKGQSFNADYRIYFKSSQVNAASFHAKPEKKGEDLLYVSLAVYEHKPWQQILADPEMTCQ